MTGPGRKGPVAGMTSAETQQECGRTDQRKQGSQNIYITPHTHPTHTRTHPPLSPSCCH